MAVPKRDELFNPLLKALRNLGGSGSNAELIDETARIMVLSDEQLDERRNSDTVSDLKGPRKGPTRFAYRLAWARTYLKKFGLVTNSERGVWSLTPRGSETSSVDPTEVKLSVRARRRDGPPSPAREQSEETAEGDMPDGVWRETLLNLLLELAPEKFERLCQRILRESGFVNVEVTGRSGDGGIDGTGAVELGDLLAFPVLFQCKRYQGGVGPSVVRDFRGAMVGRADRGLILTTGVFTGEARREARRDGAPPIDLIDRDRLLEKLKALKLGIEVELVESPIGAFRYVIAPLWGAT